VSTVFWMLPRPELLHCVDDALPLLHQQRRQTCAERRLRQQAREDVAHVALLEQPMAHNDRQRRPATGRVAAEAVEQIYSTDRHGSASRLALRFRRGE
jgi:hypothetical protein